MGLGKHLWATELNLDFNVGFLNNLDLLQQVNPGIEWDVNETMRAYEYFEKDRSVRYSEKVDLMLK